VPRRRTRLCSSCTLTGCRSRGDSSAQERGEFLRTQSEIRQRTGKQRPAREALPVRLRQLRATIDPTWLARLHRTKVPLYPPHFATLLAGWRTQFTAFEVLLSNSHRWEVSPRPETIQLHSPGTGRGLPRRGLSSVCGYAVLCEPDRACWYLFSAVPRIRRVATKVQLVRFNSRSCPARPARGHGDEILTLGEVVTSRDPGRDRSRSPPGRDCRHLQSEGGQGMGSMRALRRNREE
jgi:hypothetical protein